MTKGISPTPNMDSSDRDRIDRLTVKEMWEIVLHTPITQWPFIDKEVGEYFLERWDELHDSGDPD